MKQLMSIGNDRQMNDALMKEKVEQVQQNRLLIKEVNSLLTFRFFVQVRRFFSAQRKNSIA